MSEQKYLMTNTSELIAESYIDENSGALVNKNVPIARTGIFHYRGVEFGFNNAEEACKTYKAYRDESSFNEEVLETFKGIPVTLDHPDEGIDTKNYKKVSVGNLNENLFLKESGNVQKLYAEKFIIRDADAIKSVNSGNKQVSIGFYAVYEFAPGVNKFGETYDCTEKIVAANHVAIVVNGKGKAGAEYRLNSVIDYEGDTMNDEKLIKNANPDDSLLMVVRAQNATIENMTARITALETNSDLRFKSMEKSIKAFNEDFTERSLKNEPSLKYDGKGGKGIEGMQSLSEGGGDAYTQEMIDKFKGKNVNTQASPGKTTIADIGLNEKEDMDEKLEEKESKEADDCDYDMEEKRPGVNAENIKHRKSVKNTAFNEVFSNKKMANSAPQIKLLRTADAFRAIDGKY